MLLVHEKVAGYRLCVLLRAAARMPLRRVAPDGSVTWAGPAFDPAMLGKHPFLPPDAPPPAPFQPVYKSDSEGEF